MSNPKLIPVPFADGGTYTNISTNRGSGDALEQPNYSEGFPTITSTPLAAGGKAPRREDFNGLLHDLSENISHLNKGGFFMFDVDFCAQIGGYPKGSVLLSNDKTKKYTSLIDNNTSNFNVSADPSKWVQSWLTETEVKAIAWGEGQTSAPWSRASSFLSGKSYNGWQKLEGGLIIQWGVSSYVGTSGATGTVCNLPIVFPNAGLQIVVSDVYAGVNPCAAAFENKSQVRVWGKNVDNLYVDTIMRFIAIGY